MRTLIRYPVIMLTLFLLLPAVAAFIAAAQAASGGSTPDNRPDWLTALWWAAGGVGLAAVPMLIGVFLLIENHLHALNLEARRLRRMFKDSPRPHA